MVIAATGFFDGVHTGHQKVLKQMALLAEQQGKKSAVITFWPHPRSVLQKGADCLRLLNTIAEKKVLVKGVGVNKFITIPFTKDFSKLSTMEFLRDILLKKYGVTTLIIGYDHRFGHDILSQEEMIEVAAELGIEVVRVSEFSLGENIVSSTKIRNLLREGLIEKANHYLGYRYGLKGVVVSGQRVGRTIGFPTANMKLYEPLKLIPADGVYSVFVEVLGKVYIGICNIGTRPTIANNNERSIETHILGFNEDIYGLDIKLEFIECIRKERKFPSLEALKEQLHKDKEYANSTILDIPVRMRSF